MHYIDKHKSIALKGIAVILMVFGHCMGHPEYWDAQYTFVVPDLFRSLTRLSVGLFTFLAGYSCYINSLYTRAIICRVLALKKLYIHYYTQTLFIFLPIALLRGYNLSITNIFYNVSGLINPLILFAWYVPFFTSTIILLVPLIRSFIRSTIKNDVLIGLIIGITIKVGLYLVRGYSKYLFIFCDWSNYYLVYIIGFIFAKHNLFEIVNNYFERINQAKVIKIILYCVGIFMSLVGTRFMRDIKITTLEIIYGSMRKPVGNRPGR